MQKQRLALNMDRRDGQSGQAILESAFILAIFLLTLIGILDFGQIMFVHETLVERTRAALRTAVVDSTCDATCVQNLVVYRSRTSTGAAGDGLRIANLSTSNVSVTMPDANPADNTAAANRRIIITISNYNFLVISPFITRAGSMQMRAIVATAPIENPNG